MIDDYEKYLDEDGYPTEEALNLIDNWDMDNIDGLFIFLKNLWWSPDWGWKEEEEESNDRKIKIYSISTGGWSGNEELIRHLKKKELFWEMCLLSYRRGGHYQFDDRYWKYVR